MPRKKPETGENSPHSMAAPKKTGRASKSRTDGRKKTSLRAKGAGKQKAAPAAILGSGDNGDATFETATMGRPTEFREEYVEQAQRLAEIGWTDIEMADFFGVSDRTFYRWQNAHEHFRQAIKLGKDAPDDRMEYSLYHRGKGFEWYEEQAIKLKDVKYEGGKKVSETERIEVVKIKRQAPPDSTAAIFWLKNRRGWKDKSEIDHGVTDTLAALMAQIDGRTPRIPGHVPGAA